MNKDNIILIGMPGSGKSTVGVLLAKILGYGFIDSDLLIQAAENSRLYEIIEKKGNDYFRELENRINSQITVQKTVIATGGSAVYGSEAMKHLCSIGTVVYLKVTEKELERRIKDLSTRGIMMEKGSTLSDLYKQRKPLYEKYADITVSLGNAGLQKSAEKIINAVNNYKKGKSTVQ